MYNSYFFDPKFTCIVPRFSSIALIANNALLDMKYEMIELGTTDRSLYSTNASEPIYAGNIAAALIKFALTSIGSIGCDSIMSSLKMRTSPGIIGVPHCVIKKYYIRNVRNVGLLLWIPKKCKKIDN